MRNKTLLTAMAAAVVTLAALGAAAPANALTSHEPAAGTKISVPMTFSGYNAARAAKYGYDVRTTSDGYQYAVPAGTPEGSYAGSTPLFKAGAPLKSVTASGRVHVDATVTGNCGTSYVEWLSHTEFETGYTIYPWDGPSLGHKWNVVVTAPHDILAYNLNGLPRTPLTWSATRTTDIYASKGQKVEALAGGTVETPLLDCTSGQPLAIYTK